MRSSVITIGDPLLRAISEPVVEVDSNIKDILNGLVAFLESNNNALGIAAVQLGCPVRIFAAKTFSPNGEIEISTYINPVVKAEAKWSLVPEGVYQFRECTEILPAPWNLFWVIAV